MIEINNLTAPGVDNRFLKKVAKKVLKGENKENYYLSIALIGPEKIKEINRKYRKRNRATDVLSFTYRPGLNNGRNARYIEHSAHYNFLNVKKESRIQNLGLGEVVICPQQVRRNAKKLNLTFKKELSACLIHGILHLLGYDHLEKEEKKKMEKKQNHYLSLIN